MRCMPNGAFIGHPIITQYALCMLAAQRTSNSDDQLASWYIKYATIQSGISQAALLIAICATSAQQHTCMSVQANDAWCWASASLACTLPIPDVCNDAFISHKFSLVHTSRKSIFDSLLQLVIHAGDHVLVFDCHLRCSILSPYCTCIVTVALSSMIPLWPCGCSHSKKHCRVSKACGCRHLSSRCQHSPHVVQTHLHTAV